jgi:hypothetical protein
MCDSVNRTRFPEEDHAPDWVFRDKHGNKGDRVECVFNSQPKPPKDIVYRVNIISTKQCVTQENLSIMCSVSNKTHVVKS